MEDPRFKPRPRSLTCVSEGFLPVLTIGLPWNSGTWCSSVFSTSFLSCLFSHTSNTEVLENRTSTLELDCFLPSNFQTFRFWFNKYWVGLRNLHFYPTTMNWELMSRSAKSANRTIATSRKWCPHFYFCLLSSARVPFIGKNLPRTVQGRKSWCCRWPQTVQRIHTCTHTHTSISDFRRHKDDPSIDDHWLGVFRIR